MKVIRGYMEKGRVFAIVEIDKSIKETVEELKEVLIDFNVHRKLFGNKVTRDT